MFVFSPDDARSTADLWDAHAERFDSCDTQFHQFGGRSVFRGRIVTLRCQGDVGLLKAIIATRGAGRVLVVDGGGSLHRALLGDEMACTARDNGWEGLIVHGAVRDVPHLRVLDIGIKALGSNPRRSEATGAGDREVPVSFGGATFLPGHDLVSDDDGILSSRQPPIPPTDG